jgi:hypothetical protein
METTDNSSSRYHAGQVLRVLDSYTLESMRNDGPEDDGSYEGDSHRAIFNGADPHAGKELLLVTPTHLPYGDDTITYWEILVDGKPDYEWYESDLDLVTMSIDDVEDDS